MRRTRKPKDFYIRARVSEDFKRKVNDYIRAMPDEDDESGVVRKALIEFMKNHPNPPVMEIKRESEN